MPRPMIVPAALVLTAALAAGCSTIEGGAVIPDGTTARLDVLRASEVSLRNDGAAPLSLEVGWGQAGRTKDQLLPGVTRWWAPDGPRSYWIINASGRPVALTYTVRGADASFAMPAR